MSTSPKTTNGMNRRSSLKALAGALALPGVFPRHGMTAPENSVLHASFGAGGMALADIQSLSRTKGFRLVAVADVDTSRFDQVTKAFPGVRVYQDWRVLLDKEKDIQSANISTPDHMHAPITMAAMNRGLHVYTQKPLTQTIFEARRLTEVAKEKKLVTQMGIQIHSHEVHRTVVATIHSGAIGKVKAVHSWSGKEWGDDTPKPTRKDTIPTSLDWNGWLGVAQERPFLTNYYHPGNRRKRLDFGTGTFGDMGCHILDPVYESLGVGYPKSVVCEKGGPIRTVGVCIPRSGMNSREVATLPKRLALLGMMGTGAPRENWLISLKEMRFRIKGPSTLEPGEFSIRPTSGHPFFYRRKNLPLLRVRNSPAMTIMANLWKPCGVTGKLLLPFPIPDHSPKPSY